MVFIEHKKKLTLNEKKKLFHCLHKSFKYFTFIICPFVILNFETVLYLLSKTIIISEIRLKSTNLFEIECQMGILHVTNLFDFRRRVHLVCRIFLHYDGIRNMHLLTFLRTSLFLPPYLLLFYIFSFLVRYLIFDASII